MDSTNHVTGTARVKRGLAEMLKGGVIMDVVTADQARIAEEAGAVAVMALFALSFVVVLFAVYHWFGVFFVVVPVMAAASLMARCTRSASVVVTGTMKCPAPPIRCWMRCRSSSQIICSLSWPLIWP